MESRERFLASKDESENRGNGVNSVVAAKLHGLPSEQRDVLILKVQEHKSYAEIAEVLGMTRENVTRLIHTGLTALAHELRSVGVLQSS